MKVLVAAAEALPYYNTGGLAEVARSLPDALHARAIDVRIILPAYPGVRVPGGSIEREPELEVPWVGGAIRAGCRLHQLAPQRAPAVLLEQPIFFDVQQPYGAAGEDPVSLVRRFAFFSRAVVAYAARWGADVVHLNDWQTGLVPIYSLVDAWFGATAFAIHNLPYQGNFPRGVLRAIGVPDSFYRTENGLEYHGNASFIKAGLALADRLVTVSPTYAREIQTPAFGAGLEGLLQFRRRVLHGILNGINPELWDPVTDSVLAANYDASDLSGKETNRSAVLAELGLSDGGPLLVMVTRLAHQKGVDLLLEAMPNLIRTNARIALLGNGEAAYHHALAAWAEREPGRVAVRFDFDDRLARRLYAGGDFFLMPSLYEPCGLGQMIAQRYGTPPIVRRTGGLADTVEHGKTGFVFDHGAASSLIDAMEQALAAWRVAGWNPLRKRCMRLDRSWGRSARAYEQVYRLAIGHVSA
jgi:starch synthase